MIRSMTGFGRTEGVVDGMNVQVEVRALNGKQHDVMVKTSTLLRVLEPQLRQLSQEHLVRGRVELTVFMDHPEKRAQFNADVVKAYYDDLKALADQVAPDHQHDLLGTVLRMPDVMTTDQTNLGDGAQKSILNLVKGALQQCTTFRETEGAEVQNDLRTRVQAITELLQQAEGLDNDRNDRIRERLHKAFEQAELQGDPNRFEQELVYYLEKLDINEEKVRLAGHCDLFIATMNNEEGQGRKLNFIAQEMGREINTLGSKANDMAIQHIVVEMKDELDKIKEQTLNVL